MEPRTSWMAVRHTNHYTKQAVKMVSPLQAMKDNGACGCKGSHIFAAKALGRGRVTNSTLGHFYTRESPGTHFIGDWVDPTTSLDSKERKNLHPLRHQGSIPGCPARSQAPCRLSYLNLF